MEDLPGHAAGVRADDELLGIFEVGVQRLVVELALDDDRVLVPHVVDGEAVLPERPEGRDDRPQAAAFDFVVPNNPCLGDGDTLHVRLHGALDEFDELADLLLAHAGVVDDVLHIGKRNLDCHESLLLLAVYDEGGGNVPSLFFLVDAPRIIRNARRFSSL